MPTFPDGTFDVDGIDAYVRPRDDPHQPFTALICVESSHNNCGGKVLPLDFLAQVHTHIICQGFGGVVLLLTALDGCVCVCCAHTCQSPSKFTNYGSKVRWHKKLPYFGYNGSVWCLQLDCHKYLYQLFINNVALNQVNTLLLFICVYIFVYRTTIDKFQRHQDKELHKLQFNLCQYLAFLFFSPWPSSSVNLYWCLSDNRPGMLSWATIW